MLIKQFKKDYVPYLIGIIIPAIVSFVTIPVFKIVLGPSQFGIYTFYLSLLLIVNASFAGAISQSIIRLHVDYVRKNTFYIESVFFTLLISSALALPLFTYIFFNYHFISFALLFVVTLLVSNVYSSLLAITQARLMSVNTAISESMRTIIYLSLTLLLLHFFPTYSFLLLIFIALFSSYVIVCFFLLYKNQLSYSLNQINITDWWTTCKKICNYGGYMVGWFFLCYAISMANRFILAQHLGKENIGHFTASFDMLNKSIALLLSPVLISLFPLVVKAHAAGQFKQVKKLIRQLIILEGLLLAISLALYPFIGFPILNKLLQTPPTNEYLFLEMQVIAGTFIWQMALLQHKFLELKKRSKRMLLFVAISFAISFSLDAILIPTNGVLLAGSGYLAGSIVYFLLTFYHKGEIDSTVF